MSHGELSRYDTLLRFQRGELRVEAAAMLLGVGRRQVYRLLDRLRAGGPEALVSWKRGRTSNRDFGESSTSPSDTRSPSLTRLRASG